MNHYQHRVLDRNFIPTINSVIGPTLNDFIPFTITQ